jgi:putative nucleotidyltransferase with HDIG domain
VGVLTAMLQTLSLRDKMTARHCAAVARYAREIAREHGCDEEEQDLVHTAGLLHDIGKFIFPDHILLANTKLSDDDWEIVKKHPAQGAKVVRGVDGYGPVADIILAHHEKIDGKGYPNGLKGDEIPLASRMISVADTYDVMTARDSYRDPVSPAEAVAELRRVSGTQLDGHLVELFLKVLERKGVAFHHGDDADFESELDLERRIRQYAAGKTPVSAS